MSRFRPSGMALLATLFIVVGFGLMFASLRVEQQPAVDADAPADVVVPTTAAARAAASLTPAPSEEKATRLFARAQLANRDLAYTGVKQVSRSIDGQRTVTVVTVQHLPGHGTVVTPRDGSSSSVLTVEPVAQDESTAMSALVTNYRLVSAGTEAVRGRSAQVLEARRPDDTLAARFWIDEDTSLVLRRDLVATDGQSYETTEYLEISVSEDAPTASPAPTPVAPSASPSPSAWSVVSDVASLRTGGWQVPQTLGDGLVLYQVRERGTTEDRVLQLIYTDGLSALSVFEQQGTIDRTAMTDFVPVEMLDGEVWVRRGAGSFYTWRYRPPADPSGAASGPDLVVSTLADSARAPVGAVLVAFPPAAADEVGVGDHVTRGVQRVGSWIDPLG